MRLLKKRFEIKLPVTMLAAVLLLAGSGVASAQNANEYERPEVVNIASKLLCNCGCNLDMACVMPPSGVCGICRENKIKISAMLKDGLTEQQILDLYAEEYGESVLAQRPGLGGFAAPYIALALGLVLVAFVIKRYTHLKPAPVVAPGSDADLARFQKQIDKNMEDLD